MRVEITELRLKDTDPDTGQQYDLQKGDILPVPDSCGFRWCTYGWAKDVDGVIATGERIPGTRTPLWVNSGTVRGN